MTDNAESVESKEIPPIIVPYGATSALEPNPYPQAMGVTLTVPKNLEIKLVQLHSLTEYEIWFFFTTLYATAFFAFLSMLYDTDDNRVKLLLGVFGLFLVLCIIMTLYKRRILKCESVTYKGKLADLEAIHPISGGKNEKKVENSNQIVSGNTKIKVMPP